MFEHWLQRTGQGGTDLYAAEPEEASNDFVTDTAFDNPEGRMEVDTGMDPEFEGECPFQMQISAQRMSVNKIDLLDDCKVENTLKGE